MVPLRRHPAGSLHHLPFSPTPRPPSRAKSVICLREVEDWADVDLHFGGADSPDGGVSRRESDRLLRFSRVQDGGCRLFP